MSSIALHNWRSRRGALLDQLLDAHVAVGGGRVGRRWVTSELNRALVGRVAAQFQGFAKELHTEVAVTFSDLAAPQDRVVARAVATALQTDRQLDRFNAQRDSLASDFGRFGVDLWADMDRRDARTPTRRDHLSRFNTARNALAHDDTSKLEKVTDAGYPIDLTSIRRWRGALDGIAGTLDVVMATHLAKLFEVPRPW